MSVAVQDQVAWARDSVLVVAAPERCVLEVTGSDRLSWLNGLLTCQLAARAEGEAVLGLAVAPKGKIVSDVLVVVARETVFLAVQRSAKPALLASFEHHLMMEDAELKEGTREVWLAHGPRGASVLEAARGAGGVGGLLDFTGSGGAVVIAEAGDAAIAAMEAAAREAGGGAGDARGWDVVRVLTGVPSFGVDFDDATYPQEAALEKKAVSFDKGCYLGQEVVCMLEMRGHVKRKLVSLAIDADDPPSAHTSVDDGKGASVGEVTSSARASDGAVRALAMVKYAFIETGTTLAVGGHAARVL